MTRSTSSRSVKGTPKTDDEQASNGTPPTDPDSVTISVPSPESARETTGWTIQFANGGVHHIRVKGGRGRISFSPPRGGVGGEIRVYRNESTKTFDAVFTNVTHVVSDRVEVIPAKWGQHDQQSEPRFTGDPPKKKAEEKKNVTLSSGGTLSSTWTLVPELKLNPEDF